MLARDRENCCCLDPIAKLVASPKLPSATIIGVNNHGLSVDGRYMYKIFCFLNYSRFVSAILLDGGETHKLRLKLSSCTLTIISLSLCFVQNFYSYLTEKIRCFNKPRKKVSLMMTMTDPVAGSVMAQRSYPLASTRDARRQRGRAARTTRPRLRRHR